MDVQEDLNVVTISDVDKVRAHIVDIVAAHLNDDPLDWLDNRTREWGFDPKQHFSFESLCEYPEHYRRKPEPETHRVTRWEHKGTLENVYRAISDGAPAQYGWEEKETFTHIVGQADED